MGAPSQTAMLDKIASVGLGIHSGVSPTELLPSQESFAVNVTFRGGKAKTRPVIRKMLMNYDTETTESRFTQALFQGASFHRGFGTHLNCLLASIGGRIFRATISGQNVNVKELTGADVNNPTLDQAWLFQGEDFTVINDGQKNPFFFDGASLRRAVAGELPPSCMGAYVNGRFIVVKPDRRSYIASDLVYNVDSGTPAYNYRDSILKISENTSILGGRSFAVPMHSGDINAVFGVMIPDVPVGQGPFQIGTRTGIFSVFLPLDANEWLSTQQPVQTISLPNSGPLSHYSVATLNGDAWYRAADGIRSFMVARREFNTWVQTPLSFEMQRVIDLDTEHLLNHCSTVNFNSRILMTCAPQVVAGRGTTHKGLIALDFNNISSITHRDGTPSYDGLWTGLPILQIVTGEFSDSERCFMFGLDGDGDICIYELLKDGMGHWDFDGESNVEIESWIESHALFGIESFSERVQGPQKKLLCADMFLEKLWGNVAVDVKYRSDAYPLWRDWKDFSLCATTVDCPEECVQPQEVQYQYATYRRLPIPADDCNPITGRLYRSGYYFQMRIQWTGHAELDKVYVWADPIPEIAPGCPSEEACKVLKGCPITLFGYNIED